MTNGSRDPNRLEELLEETIQVTRSNAKAIEALSADVAASRADIAANRDAIAATRASVDGLVQVIAEFSARSEARLNRLDEAVIGIERILERLVRDQDGGAPPHT